ncbi:hypothetical protein [Streptomyces sudanensis]|uniref:hypothetical protein n=1 Tax=Streptomyces sudanensis TaxID=436397 RepID=UPI0020CF4E35|nr:hypothetical protein [Streptomyces sudanensis]MCP9959309.1 hypothetical protein [Streptomyces sudanensis]MCQ0000235.1 hypothetical protein [Streptomyces sudanensis]
MDWSWWTVLYIAFGVVALWLLGEVLLQYKARLRWRLLAFVGFLGVVAGVLVSSLVLIIAGAAAFGVGQTLVTLSFLRGFSTGWALGGRPGASRRRRTAGEGRGGPALEVTGLAYDAPQPPGPPAADGPLPEETGAYGTDGAHPPQPAPTDPSAAHHPGAYGDRPEAYDAYPGAYGDRPEAYGAGPAPYGGPADGYGEHPAYGPYAPAPAPAPDHGHGTQQYAAFPGPYADPAPAGAPQYDVPDSYGQPHPVPQYPSDTPPGGVWVPPQRDGTQQFPPLPPHLPYPYDHDQDARRQHR